MIISYILIIILLFHIVVFRKLIFNWNLFSAFFITTFVFSIVGILAFSFAKEYADQVFRSFKLELISDRLVFKTQIIAVTGFLLVLYGYIFGINLFFKKVKCINHFRITGSIKNNLSRTNFFFMIIVIALFLIFYLFLKRNALITGISDGLLGRQPIELIKARRSITSNYFHVIVTYNLLPFLTIVSLYLTLNRRNLFNKLLFICLFLSSFALILLLFQKRPLIIFLGTTILAFFVFKRNLYPSKKIVLSGAEKRQKRRKVFLYIGSLFSLLLLLYYSATTYEFNNLFEAIWKLSEVALTRVFGRLSMPAFLYVHYFSLPNHDHYYFTNIGLLSQIFDLNFFPDTKILYEYYSIKKNNGSLAVNSIMDFYGAFGYYGLILGNLFLGFILSCLDTFLNKLEKNNINIIFTILTFVFAYYLSQASLARSLMGYGFVFFVFTWLFLQKGFKIKLRL